MGIFIKKSEATRKPAYHRKWVSEDLGAGFNFRAGCWEEGSGRRNSVTGTERVYERGPPHWEGFPVRGAKMAEMRSTVALTGSEWNLVSCHIRSFTQC